MTEREKILADPLDWTADELLLKIKENKVTFEELMKLPIDVYNIVEKKELEKKHEKYIWPLIQNSTSIEELEHFKEVHSLNDYAADFEACDRRIQKLKDKLAQEKMEGTAQDKIRREIKKIEKNVFVANKIERITERLMEMLEEPNTSKTHITAQDILKLIKEDHNALSAYCVYSLLNKKIFGYSDLKEIGIDERFIDYMYNNPPAREVPNLPNPGRRLVSIPDGYTEFYFWGIPASGKTCALGGILSAANNGRVCVSMDADTKCQGYGYMSELANIFKPDMVSLLPGGTAVQNTYEMRFSLTGRVENSRTQQFDNKQYNCACVDLAGELFTCLYLSMANEELDDDQKGALAILKKILVENRSRNSKIHFFVIEYGAEDKLYHGLTQQFYLDKCVDYIRDHGIFHDNTDRVYILITKADKFNKSEKSETEELKQYVRDHYLGFYKKLREICRKEEINNGHPGLIAFSVGDVCFQNYCIYKPEKSEGIVYDCLLDTVYGQTTGFLGKARRGLGK